MDWEHPGNWLQNLHKSGETDYWRAQTKPFAHQDSGERSSDHTRDWSRLACECPGVFSGGAGWQWPAAGSGALNTTVHAQDLLQDVAIIFITPTIVWSQVKQQEGNTAPPTNRKFDWRFTNHDPAHQKRPSFPHSQSLPSGSFHKPLILISQRAGRMRTTITENWSHRPQPCLAQWNYEPCHVGPPKMDGSWWRVLTKRGPLEKGMANHFSILALRIRIVWQGRYE